MFLNIRSCLHCVEISVVDNDCLLSTCKISRGGEFVLDDPSSMALAMYGQPCVQWCVILCMYVLYWDQTCYLFQQLCTRGRRLCAEDTATQEVPPESQCHNRPGAQIPQCTSPISHNVPFFNRNVYISVKKWCIVRYSTNTLWDLWFGFIQVGLFWVHWAPKRDPFHKWFFTSNSC